MGFAGRLFAHAALGSLALAADPAAALDVTGRWLLNTGQLAELVQSGTSLDVTLSGSTLSGTIDAGGRFTAFLFAPPCELAVGGRVVGEIRLVGSTAALCGSITESTISGIRCECSDGNTATGDGCDARCQIEPCFTCSGTPSVCVPSGDGASCDDRDVCTSGETCSAGMCGGGSQASPCVDLSGQWLEHLTVPALGVEEFSIVDVVQVGTILEFGGSPTSLPLSFGTIDPASGAMEKGTGVGLAFCTPADLATGTTAPDGDTYVLSGLRHVVQDDLFCEAFGATITGTRCMGPCSTTTTVTTSTSTTTTTAPLLLGTRRLLLKDAPDPARRRFMLFSKDSALAISGSSSDDPTVVGATLRVRTAAGCGGPCDATYALPADGWHRIGASGDTRGYGYGDRQLAAGPVRTLLVKSGKALKIAAKGAQLAHALTSSPAPVDVVLTLGTRQMCLRAGGATRFTSGRKYSATGSPAPAACF